MRKIVFYISLVLSVAFLVNILNILLIDSHRLSEFGYGYLTAQIILMLIFAVIAYFMLKKKTPS
ncbi:hypothetical protein [Flavobacterium sp.]|uniref:hypothetical protein n=1 Tax=Flavobacterium sp. TaxID=239 RepID=UPI0026079017|nr:hypothetical protein [Flavobacterium sp.]MDD2986572.1 hypothetical protein [Flavobacterium sp.]